MERPWKTPLTRASSVVILTALTLLLAHAVDAQRSHIPMQMRRRMSEARSTSDFIHTMVRPRPPAQVNLTPEERLMFGTGTQTGSFNAQGVEVMSSVIAPPDLCEPRPSTVHIPPDPNPRVVYWPTCTPVPRCGGCCGIDLLECAPTSTDTIVVEVMRMELSADDSSRYDYTGTVNVSLVRHLACDCQCRTQPHHCNPALQYYDEDSCTCRCRNEDGATSCVAPKRWDDKSCSCMCPTLVHCLDDEIFNFNTCRCEVQTSTRAEAVSAPSPCDAHVCRAGYHKVVVGSACQCQRPAG